MELINWMVFNTTFNIISVISLNFKIDENGRKFSKQVKNTVGKG